VPSAGYVACYAVISTLLFPMQKIVSSQVEKDKLTGLRGVLTVITTSLCSNLSDVNF
jgi:hypothetical protein